MTSTRNQPYDPVMTSHVVDQPGPTPVSYTHLTLPTKA